MKVTCGVVPTVHYFADDGILHTADSNVILEYYPLSSVLIRPLFITYLFFFSLFWVVFQLHIFSVINLLPVVLEAGERLHVVLRKLLSVTYYTVPDCRQST